MTPKKRMPPLHARHNALLGPCLNTHRGSPPHDTILAVTCLALTNDVPVSELRAWFIANGPEPVKIVAKNRSVFGRLVASARSRVTRFSSPSGRARLRLAMSRRLVGCLLSHAGPDVGLSSQRVEKARAALAVLGAEFLYRATEDGFDTVVFSADRLGVELGCTKRTANQALAACVELGWLQPMKSRAGYPRRWKLRQLTQDRGGVAWAHADLVEALVDEDDTNPFVEVFRAVDHPAVTYGGIGHRPWLVGLCVSAGVDPVDVGMTKRTVNKFRAQWAAVVDGDTGLPITKCLDEYAKTTGAYALKDAAEDARQAEVDARKAGVEAHRAKLAKVRDGLKLMLAEYPLPKPTARPVVKTAWAENAAAWLNDTRLPDDFRPLLAKALVKTMERKGYSSGTASTVATFVAGVTS